MPVSSYLCESRLGWPSVFYLFGGLGVLWFVAWALLVHDGPDVHPRISPQEKLFLQVTRRYSVTRAVNGISSPDKAYTST